MAAPLIENRDFGARAPARVLQLLRPRTSLGAKSRSIRARRISFAVHESCPLPLRPRRSSRTATKPSALFARHEPTRLKVSQPRPHHAATTGSSARGVAGDAARPHVARLDVSINLLRWPLPPVTVIMRLHSSQCCVVRRRVHVEARPTTAGRPRAGYARRVSMHGSAAHASGSRCGGTTAVSTPCMCCRAAVLRAADASEG